MLTALKIIGALVVLGVVVIVAEPVLLLLTGRDYEARRERERELADNEVDPIGDDPGVDVDLPCEAGIDGGCGACSTCDPEWWSRLRDSQSPREAYQRGAADDDELRDRIKRDLDGDDS